MSLRRAASMSMVQTVASVATSFLSVKITSVFLGPAGMGLLGQLQQFVAMTQGAVGGGLNTGLIRRTAQHSADPQARARLLGTAMRLVLAAGIPVALTVVLLSGWLARALLHDPQLQLPLLLFAGGFVVALLGTLVLGAANGMRDYKAVTMMQVGGGLSTLLLFALLCPTLGIRGGLIAGALMPAGIGLVAWLVGRTRGWWPARPLSRGFFLPEARAAVAFVPMSAVSAIAAPLVQILVRDTLARQSGMASVGLLQGVTRLSDLYVNMATGVLAMYFLPRFSELRDATSLRRELKKGLKTLIPAVAAFSLALYLLRDLIVHVVFTAQFYGMRDLFAWQMTGNALKVTGWFFGHLMVAKSNPLALAGFELAMGVFWWRAGVLLVDHNGAVGATQAYALYYAVYAVIAASVVGLILRRMPARTREAAA